jgi:uncharacterized iron-regulated membrane protein
MGYPWLWRWHFWVGLVCAPILVVVSLSGALYAFRPQLEPLLEPMQQVPVGGAVLPLSQQIALAQAAVPAQESLFLFEQPQSPAHANVAFFREAEGGHDHGAVRLVFIDPYRGVVTGQKHSDEGFFGIVLKIHNDLFMGSLGSWVVEAVVSWVLVTLVMGIFLWSVRVGKAGGAFSVRKGSGRKAWRDWHSVVGFYLLPLAVVSIVSGLFFTQAASKVMLGLNFVTGQLPAIYLDPPASKPAPVTLNLDALQQAFSQQAEDRSYTYQPANHPTGTVEFHSHRTLAPWKLRWAWYDRYSGQELARIRWEELKVGAKSLLLFYPVHTGELFGWPTQALMLLGALLMIFITIAGVGMWWLRRGDQRGWAAPPAPATPIPTLLWALGAVLALLLPLVGASLLLLLLWEGLVRLKRKVSA